MRKVAVTLCAVVTVLALPAVSPARQSDTHVQLLAINDPHGHLAPNTPGNIQVGCCHPVRDSEGVQTGWT